MACSRADRPVRPLACAVLGCVALVAAGCTENPLGSPWETGDPSSDGAVIDPPFGPNGSGEPDDPDRDGGEVPVAECAAPDAAWIWCDDFEDDRLASYFEYSDEDGSFVRAGGVGMGGSTGMRARFQRGQVEAGGLRVAFGRTPTSYFSAVDSGRRDYREVFWRMYLRHEPDWIGGGGGKLSRATSFASADWSQSMIGHVWSGGTSRPSILVIDPASGTDPSGSIITDGYNDFDRLRWLGGLPGSTPIFDDDHVGGWYCIEAHVRLNDAGRANGVFELWVDGKREVRTESLNWLGSYDTYGINAVFLENHWNEGSPQVQERYFDRFVVSTERIGC